MSSALCPLSMYSRLCMKMSPLLSVHAWAMPHKLYLSCGVPFPVWTPDNISGLISIVLWLSRWKVMKKNSGNILFKWGVGQNNFYKGPFWMLSSFLMSVMNSDFLFLFFLFFSIFIFWFDIFFFFFHFLVSF